jgi:hypothetical protein
MQAHVRRIEAGDFSDAFGLRIVFAPTGLLQEVAMAGMAGTTVTWN